MGQSMCDDRNADKPRDFVGILGAFLAVLSLALTGYIYLDQRSVNLADYEDRVYTELQTKPTTAEKIKELDKRLAREKITERQAILSSIKSEFEDLLRKETDDNNTRIALETAERDKARAEEIERRRRDQAAAARALKEVQARMLQRALDRAPK